MANSGNFKTTAYDGRYLLFSWAVQSQSIQNNTTTIKWTLSGAGKASAGYYKAGNFKVVIDGKTVYSSSDRINLYDGTVVKSGTYTFTHNNTGNKSFSASAEAGIYTVAVNCKGSGTFTLPTIPRASTINSVSGNKITDTFSVKYTNYVSSYTNTLKIGVNGRKVKQSISNYLSGDSFTLSDTLKSDIYNASANSSNVKLDFTLATYNNSTLIGNSETITKSVAINDSNPTIGGISYIDTNSKTTAITGDSSKIIRGYSTLKVTLSDLKAKNSATLSKLTVEIGGVSDTISLAGTTLAVQNVDIGTVDLASDTVLKATLTDSRGNVAVNEINVSILDYEKPTALISCARKDNFYNDVILNVSASYSALDDKNDITITAQYKTADSGSYGATTAISDGTPTTLSLDNTKAWKVKIVVSDKLNKTTYIRDVEKGIPILFIDRGKSSVGVNCFPTGANSFEVDGKTIDDYISSRIQAGSVSFNCSANTMVTQEVTFPKAFSGKPRICLTANASSPQVTHLAFVSASATGFTLKYQSTIARNPAYVNWIAVLDSNSKNDSGE